MKTLSILVLLFICIVSTAQDKPAYKIFSKEGKPSNYTAMLKELSKAEVVLVGEIHNNAINHWLELQILKDLYALQPALVIGMEMFESDNQLILDEYLQGVIEERHLLQEAKVWDNYKTDYKPLVEFAKEKKLRVIATNIPRRYANLVYRKGIDALTTLPDDARQWIAPLPVTIDLELPGYKSMITNMGGHSGATGSAENMAKSQAMKDATMAHFLLKYKQGIAIHYHGAYHSQNFEGIYWYLKRTQPKLKIVTVHAVEQQSMEVLEDSNLNTADFIICMPKDMTKTY